jgi:hypothetical protein
MAGSKPRIAVFAGPTATIMNSAPLVTSNQARRRHGLPPRTDDWGRPLKQDVLRPQRIAAPVTIYVEQFSAHPLEREAASLYGPPDGYLDRGGVFHPERTGPEDVPVYEVVLRPEDGVVPLPYMARQADGSAWEGDSTRRGASPAESRQPFYPDASRIFEEIDRLGVDEDGVGNLMSRMADYDFYRVIPPGGYPTGRAHRDRTDIGDGDIEPEEIFRDYFPYRPYHLRKEPPRSLVARLTNRVQAAMTSGGYQGGLWLEGSPSTEETTYWLNLLIDTAVPLIGCQSPDFPHGMVGASGDRHLVDAVRYITSGVWKDGAGLDRVGAVLISAEQIFLAREVQKADARPGGYIATGGHGGIVGTTGEPGPPLLTYIPVWRHTHTSEVRTSLLPAEVNGIRGAGTHATTIAVRVKDDQGDLRGEAIPNVDFHKHARYLRESTADSPEEEEALVARIESNLRQHPLAGFVVEGTTPYGNANSTTDAALLRATFLGMPVVRVGRGNSEGFVSPERVKLGIAGMNLTATKARLLLMACLLRFGTLPPAADADHPTPAEIRATEAALERYQAVFDTH